MQLVTLTVPRPRTPSRSKSGKESKLLAARPTFSSKARSFTGTIQRKMSTLCCWTPRVPKKARSNPTPMASSSSPCGAWRLHAGKLQNSAIPIVRKQRSNRGQKRPRWRKGGIEFQIASSRAIGKPEGMPHVAVAASAGMGFGLGLRRERRLAAPARRPLRWSQRRNRFGRIVAKRRPTPAVVGHARSRAFRVHRCPGKAFHRAADAGRSVRRLPGY